MDSMVLQLTKRGTAFLDPAVNLGRLRSEFSQRHCIRIPQMIDPTLLEQIQPSLDISAFRKVTYEDVRISELCMVENSASLLLYFLANDRRLFSILEEITGCAPIRCFQGRVYCRMPGESGGESWHDDCVQGRLIGMSIHLGRHPFRGGLLQIREAASKKIVAEVANTGFGDAVLFRIATHLQHQNTETGGAVPKWAFAGWFQSEPDFLGALREALSSGEGPSRRHFSDEGRPAGQRAWRVEPRLNQEIVCRAIGEELLLFNPRDNSFFLLNPVGRRIWELLAEERGVEEVVSRLKEEYDVDPQLLREDIEGHLEAFHASGLFQGVG